MGVPLNHLVQGHLHRRLARAVTVETRPRRLVHTAGVTDWVRTRYAYFCISDADLLTPRHSRITRPVTAMVTRNRVLVSRSRTARHGGNRALADFQVTPPFDNNMMDGCGCWNSGALHNGDPGVSIAGPSKTPYRPNE